MKHEIEDQNGTVVVRLKGEMDGRAGDVQLFDALHRQLGAGRRRFVLDLAAIDRMDAVGLGVALTALVIVRNGSGELVAARPPDFVTSLLLITRMRDTLPTADTVDGAVQRLETQAGAPSPGPGP